MSTTARLALLLGYALVLVLGLLAVQRNPYTDWAHPVLYAVYIILLALPLLTFRRSGWFHPLVFGAVSFLLLGDAIRSLPRLTGNIPFHRALPGYGQEDLVPVTRFELILLVLSLVAYYIGFFVTPRFSAPLFRTNRENVARWRVGVLVVIGAVAWFAFIESRGGLAAHVLSFGLGRSRVLPGSFYVLGIIRLLFTGCLLWLIVDPRAARRASFWALLAMSVLGQFTTVGSRSEVVASLMIVAGFAWLRSRRLPRTGITIGLVVLFGFIIVATQIRSDAISGTLPTAESVSVERGSDMFLQEARVRATTSAGQLPILANVPENVPFLNGKSYLALLVSPVPRALWPDKPGLIGGEVGRTFFGSGAAGIPPGAVGEPYWNFGVAGVLVVYFLWGAFHNWLALVLRRNPNTPAVLMLYVMILVLVQPDSLSINSFIFRAGPVIACFVAFGYLRRDRTPTIGPRDNDTGAVTRAPG